MELRIYGAAPRADNVTKAGPGVGKSARLMPYGSGSAGGIVSKVLYDSGKTNGKSGELMPYGSEATGGIVSKVQLGKSKSLGRVVRLNAPG